MNRIQSPGPTNQDWANADLLVTKVENSKPAETIYELKKRLIVNGVEHVQYVWLNQMQLRSISLDHGL